ncbi:uncharacterized protein J3R85_019488 [Psidium guajava]|nr:uncharacterized protein J3R85_019488 [Psidium guajava]
MMAKRVEVSVGGTERKRVCVSDQQSAVVREEEKGQLRRFDGLGGFKRRESDVEPFNVRASPDLLGTFKNQRVEAETTCRLERPLPCTNRKAASPAPAVIEKPKIIGDLNSKPTKRFSDLQELFYFALQISLKHQPRTFTDLSPWPHRPMPLTSKEAVVRKQNKGAPFKFLVPLIYAPALPLIRLTLRKNPVVRDRLFTIVLAGAFAHGFYLVYPFSLHSCFLLLQSRAFSCYPSAILVYCVGTAFVFEVSRDCLPIFFYGRMY